MIIVEKENGIGFVMSHIADPLFGGLLITAKSSQLDCSSENIAMERFGIRTNIECTFN